MQSNPLSQAVDGFTHTALTMTDSDLELKWAWQSYDAEGLRFAFFRTYEELRALAAQLSTLCPPINPARHILAHYHAAFRDLQAVLLGIDAETADTAPAEGEWSIRETYAHLLAAEISFFVVSFSALERRRGGETEPIEVPDEAWGRIIGIPEEEYRALLGAPLKKMQAAHARWHARVLDDLSGATADDLELPVRYWEDNPMPFSFRLGRFDSHLRQHTVQIEKVRCTLQGPPGEVLRLLRHIYTALAEAESWQRAAHPTGDALARQTAASIQERTAEMAVVLQENQ